ncbi:MAG: hypothetical protein ABI895_41360, partial [Deltaproteobacteria bacterium]
MSVLLGALCPACRHGLAVGGASELISCERCLRTYPWVEQIPVLLPDPEQHVALWRRQLGLLLERGRHTHAVLMEAAQEQGRAEATGARLSALARAAKTQVEDLASILEPALGGALPAKGDGLPRGVVEYIGYLYRDWGWPALGYSENEPALAELGRLLGDRELGRMLVFGAGACGL